MTKRSEESEKAIEAYLRDEVRKRGGLALKYSNPSQKGFPDRLVIVPGGRYLWVELKSKGKRPTELQTYRHAELANLGCDVYVADSRGDIDNLITAYFGS